MRDFSIAHGGFNNDITRHIKWPIHQQRFKDSSSNIVCMVAQCSVSVFPNSFLDKAESCTREMNISYSTNKEQEH